MKKKLLLLICFMVLLSGCSKKLKNGDDVLVSFDSNTTITTDDLYQDMKQMYGAQAVTDLIDEKLLSTLYKETDEEKTYIKSQIKTVKDAAKNAGVSLDTYLYYYYGIKDEDGYTRHLRLDYRRDLYAKDYAKESVTETAINEYYETQVVGDIEASQILISVDTSNLKEDEDKEAAKVKAKDKAKDIIEKLKKGADFATLAKENSDDELTASKGGSLGKVNRDDVSEEVFNALRSLKDGAYSTTPVETTTGYYILFRTSQDEKKELDDKLKEEIKQTIADETLKSNTSYKYTAMKALREKNKADIKDSELKDSYNDYNINY